MTTVTEMKPLYTLAERARHGTEIYERDIRGLVESEHRGRVVAIDIDTGTFAIGDTALAASRTLRQQRPDAQVWLVRVGYPSLRRMGGQSRTAR